MRALRAGLGATLLWWGGIAWLVLVAAALHGLRLISIDISRNLLLLVPLVLALGGVALGGVALVLLTGDTGHGKRRAH